MIIAHIFQLIQYKFTRRKSMKGKKIVLIGSGSQFTEFYLQELFKYPEFKGVTLAFVDRKPDRLKVVCRS